MKGKLICNNHTSSPKNVIKYALCWFRNKHFVLICICFQVGLKIGAEGSIVFYKHKAILLCSNSLQNNLELITAYCI